MFCKECGKEINDKAVICVHCGVPTTAPLKRASQPDAAMMFLLPVGRSGYAIAAGYLGLLSVFLIFAPFALLFGILGIRDIIKNKDKHGMGRAILGIIMGAIFSIALVVFTITQILAH